MDPWTTYQFLIYYLNILNIQEIKEIKSKVIDFSSFRIYDFLKNDTLKNSYIIADENAKL